MTPGGDGCAVGRCRRYRGKSSGARRGVAGAEADVAGAEADVAGARRPRMLRAVFVLLSC